MKLFRRQINRRGFSAVEAMAAVVIMTSVGIAASRLIQQSLRASVKSANKAKANELAQMVLQQYNAYAGNNFASLPLYDTGPQGKSAAEFFHSDSAGYEGMTIITHSAFDDSHTNAMVEVVINRGQGAGASALNVKKLFTAALGSAGSGEVAQVYVRVPCPDPVCPGIPGVGVSANSVRANHTVQGVTDATGLVTLWGVGVTDNNQFTLIAPAFSSFTISSDRPDFKTAYYALDTNGHYTNSITISTQILSGVINQITITAFSPAGFISGRVTDRATGNPMPNSRVSLQAGGILPINGSFYTCLGGGDCSVYTANDGTYRFSNAIPSALTVAFDGIEGSAPIVPPGPGFQQGYTDPVPAVKQISDWQTTGPGTAPQLTVNSSLVPLTSLTIQVQKADHSPSPSATVWAGAPGLPPTAFRGNYFGFNTTTDANGRTTWYNVFASNYSYSYFAIGVAATNGLHASPDFVCTGDCTTAAQSTVITLPNGYTLQAHVVDDNPGALPNSQSAVGFKTYIGGSYIYSLTNASGMLSLAQFQGNTNDPSQPFSQYFYISYMDVDHPWWDKGSGGPAIVGGISGTVYDSQSGAPAVDCPVTIENSGGATATRPTATTDNSGHYTLTNIPLGYYETRSYNLICDNTTSVCYPCPTMGTCTLAAAQASGELHIDTRKSNVVVGAAATVNGTNQGWGGPRNYSGSAIDGQTITGIDLWITLRTFPVQGIVSYSGLPKAGITVTDGVTGASTVTADGTNGTTLGQYTLWGGVQNRSGGNSGSVAVTVPSQGVSNQSFVGSTHTLAIPAPADIQSPISQDFVLQSAGGGGL